MKERQLRAFGERDGDLRDLEGHTVAFIGYGNQGRAQALNLRDSLSRASVRCEIIVGALRDRTWDEAERDGFPVREVPAAVADAGIVLLLIPDEDQLEVFARDVAPGLRAGDAVVFASGYALAFEQLTPPEGVDVLLLAPRMIGRQLRQLFERGLGYYSYLSVERDATGRAWPVLLALAKGVGTLSAQGGGAFELSAREEAVLDLFHEQGFGSLLASTLMLMLDVGQQAGLPPEALILDLYLSGEAAETMHTFAELGFVEQARLHSRTSQYGGMMRTIGMDREPLRRHLQTIIDEIASGEFARRWSEERATGSQNFRNIQQLAAGANPFTPVEERIRAALHEAHRLDGAPGA
jgi:ketol-acid reductoisomerase